MFRKKKNFRLKADSIALWLLIIYSLFLFIDLIISKKMLFDCDSKTWVSDVLKETIRSYNHIIMIVISSLITWLVKGKIDKQEMTIQEKNEDQKDRNSEKINQL